MRRRIHLIGFVTCQVPIYSVLLLLQIELTNTVARARQRKGLILWDWVDPAVPVVLLEHYSKY